MTEEAVAAFAAERDVVVGVLRSLSAEEWAAPSACPGWRVQDVVTHMASSLQLVADPENAVAPETMDDMEAAQEVPVRARRDWSPEQALELYDRVSGLAVDAFAALQSEGLRDVETPMGNLGTHPMHRLADAFAFDAWTHLRVDLLAPGGPLVRDVPPAGEEVLRPVIDWLLVGLPQMCTAALKPVTTRRWVLRLTGPAGGEWTISPTDGPRACTVHEGADTDAAFVVTSDAADFVSWSTRRTDWRDHASVTGDADAAATVLDAINLI